ncbi:Nuclease-related domain-containing protein [Desulfomicrobium apsheronum]|uniref:Nuclease-related domain-containing protein n=1 Tax=Desulfomicrobium apsheronum TaxID=52560 RepID=A0A1I3YZC0_9BACT|nr:nuclease-related domain-containing protein [Desulfomicrobium apsheronum]SFK36709.1 Nuclease-related domain-containing protein [Desulfomicrobium apsheronum]
MISPLLIILAIIVIVIVKGVLPSRSFKGWLGEFLVRQTVSTQLDKDDYRQFHDVTLPTADGTTQIDHIIVSIYGIFVIETKNMGGWIFGDPNHPKWTQTFGKSKKSFQNPLRQNYKHIKELESLLQIGEDKLFSVVVFAGDAEFKTDMPDNVIHRGRLARHILAKNTPLMTESEVQRILLKINGTMLERSQETSRQHVRNLNRKFGNSEDETERERQLILLKMAGIIGIFLIVAVLLNSPESPTHKPAAPASITVSTPVPAAPAPPVTPLAPVVFQRHELPKPKKVPRSDEYGILTLSAKKDTYVTLYDTKNAEVVRMEIREGQSEEVEIRKGSYKAEILQTGKREVSTVSFIGDTGVLEF